MQTMDDNMRDILESLVFIKERMATKDDLNALRTEFEEFREETRENFASLRAELRDSASGSMRWKKPRATAPGLRRRSII